MNIVHLRQMVSSVSLAALLVVSPSLSRLSAAEKMSPLDLARQLNEAFVSVADDVSKSVVVIEVAYKDVPRRQPPVSLEEFEQQNPWLDKLPEGFRKFLLPDGPDDEPSEAPPGGREPAFSGSGSGVIIRKDGYIVTNHHVVDDAEKIRVRLKDGREFDAVVKGTDEFSEIAVIKIADDSVTDLPVATFADSDNVRVGEFAIAIGTPFTLDYSVTIGHVSAKGRGSVVPLYMGGGKMDQDFIQTDANINPGNSGGPLVNIEGEVIGINTLIRGLGTGVGFAVPSNLARQVSDQLIKTGKFERAWLGIGIQNLNDFPNPDMFAPGRKFGMVVVDIPKGAPAYGSDLKPSDVIVAVNGVEVHDIGELRTQVRAQPMGSTLTLDVVRGTKELKIDVKTGNLTEAQLAGDSRLRRRELPAPEVIPLGISVKEINSETAKKYDIKGTQGVVVTAVEPESPAARLGISAGMVITDVNHHAVTSLKEYDRLVGEADVTKGVLINFVDAEGNSSFTVIKE